MDGHGQHIQWASELRYQFNAFAETDFSAKQALGAPDAFPPGMLHQKAFRLKEQGSYGTMVVAFEKSQRISQLIIVESYHPGRITQIKLIDENGIYYSVYKNAPSAIPDDFRTLVLSLPRTAYRVSAVEITMNSIPVPGYCQIDAVGLLDEGTLHDVARQLGGANFNVQPVLSFNAPKEKLGRGINSRFTEAKPMVSHDGNTLYFARMFHPDNVGGKYDQQDIYFSRRVHGAWSEAMNLGGDLNDEYANGVCSISPDGQSLLLINGYENDGKVSPGVSVSKRTSSGWGTPKKIGITDYFNTSKFQDFFLSADEEVLLMAVERKEGFGQQDLYVSFRSGYACYSKPIHLGMSINTSEAEFAPFLSPDNTTLYFASEGHRGYGQSDIYRSRRLDQSWKRWSKPENLGPAINTSSWEGYFSITVAGDYAYFVSSEGEKNGAENIYRISLLQNDIPEPQQPLIAFQGRVLDARTGLPIQAEVVIDDRVFKNPYAVFSDALTGNFLIYLPEIKSAMVRAQAKGYRPHHGEIRFREHEESGRSIVTLYLEPDERQVPPAPDHLLFVKSQSTLLEESIGALEDLVRIMMEDPAVRIELAGHTDALGSSEAKKRLSVERVERVRAYLLQFGIDKRRIQTVGYGSAKPHAPNNTEENRAKNRRVEVRILEADS
jgi:outer membrane protein OmpA-like peptidoglycan-associated protein